MGLLSGKGRISDGRFLVSVYVKGVLPSYFVHVRTRLPSGILKEHPFTFTDMQDLRIRPSFVLPRFIVYIVRQR